MKSLPKQPPHAPQAVSAFRPRPKGYFFLTPVWGESYTKLFLETAIPAQLSPGNLPVFIDNPKSRYVIFTTPEDADTIRAAPIFQHLSNVIRVQIEYITNKIGAPHDMMSSCHKRGIVLAEQADAAALFLNPDLVFADGSFRTVKRVAEEGSDVILVPGIRTLKQGVARRLHDNFEQGGVITVQPRALMQIALDNLHPMGDSSWWEEGESDLIPANLYWRAGKEGIVARCFHLHPLMVYPQRKGATFFGTVDDDYCVAACPESRFDYIVTDSDELLTIELSDPNRQILTGFRKKSIDDTTAWAEQFSHDRHRQYFDAVVRMYAHIQDKEVWAGAERKAEEVAIAVKARLAEPTWRLLLTNRRNLSGRLIRWGQDQELHRANCNRLHSTSLLVKKDAYSWLIRSIPLLRVFITFPSRLLLLYYRSTTRIVRKLNAIVKFINGRQWRPYPWTWRYRYVTQLRRDMTNQLEQLGENILLLTYDTEKSYAAHCLGKRTQQGSFVSDAGSIKIIDRKTSRFLADTHYHAIVIERALPRARQLDAAIRELARILRPEGKLILLVNRAPSPIDKMEQEFCATASVVSQLIAPEFMVISQKTQGAVTQGLMQNIIEWMKLRAARLRLPLVLMALFFAIIMPINILLALMGNFVAFVMDAFDTTGRFYISSITIAGPDQKK